MDAGGGFGVLLVPIGDYAQPSPDDPFVPGPLPSQASAERLARLLAVWGAATVQRAPGTEAADVRALLRRWATRAEGGATFAVLGRPRCRRR